LPFPEHRQPKKPYRDNPEMYEQACIREVMGSLASSIVSDPTAALPLNVHGVRLDGVYPETRLILTLSRIGSPEELEWRLWGDDFGEVLPDDSNRPGPKIVASEVMTQVYEF
jgi:hypothetical protein